MTVQKGQPSTAPRDGRDDGLALESFLPFRLVRAAEQVSRRFAALYRDRHGLTRPEWRTLANLGQHGRMTATAIGARAAMHKTKVSRAVASLERRKWIERTTDGRDRRIEHIELTPEGRRNYLDLAELARGFEARLTAELGPAGAAALDRGLTAVEAIDQL
ncbi:DNA-binding MarR family transcriptional regulator [Hoeflea marina]|uniref:DNA-binding MarR family transcriptional regulator n=1 Tax=Hoeflea marina TaxID=274592 RepID=A0A317PDZ0_9HYPH|nr:MarR family winged helix-turn-helix transcriptional regulator [Hoeflea marina]PWV95363.1 DNA-binding MarR family transcriptional regulator [Hoeflea marina]